MNTAVVRGIVRTVVAVVGDLLHDRAHLVDRERPLSLCVILQDRARRRPPDQSFLRKIDASFDANPGFSFAAGALPASQKSVANATTSG